MRARWETTNRWAGCICRIRSRPTPRAASGQAKLQSTKRSRPTSPIDDSRFHEPGAKRRRACLPPKAQSRSRPDAGRNQVGGPVAFASCAGESRFRNHLGPRGAQHRLGGHERASGGAGCHPGREAADHLHRGRLGRRLEIGQRRHHLQARVRQAACPVDWRPRDRPKNPKTVWVGTGEAWTRNSTSVGDGVYKSTDGGDNWTNMGLKESERIGKIVDRPVGLEYRLRLRARQALERQ